VGVGFDDRAFRFRTVRGNYKLTTMSTQREQ